MQQLRSIHRFVTVLIVLFTLFLGVTGTMIQLIDLRSIVTHAPATDPNVKAMREAFDGPGAFAVRRTADYAAQALPPAFDYQGSLGRVLRAARASLGGVPLTYFEFRMDGARPVGQVGVDRGHVSFDAASGALVERTAENPREDGMPDSARNDFKHLHRMTKFGNWALAINIFVSIALPVMIVTGIILYFRLLGMRRRINRPNPFWTAGGTWRSLHRSISIVAAVILIVITLSGAWLAVESVGMGLAMRGGGGQRQGGPPGSTEQRPARPPRPPRDPALSPLHDADLPAMLRVTLAAAGGDVAGDPVKVVQLRTFAGYPQGVVVTGGDDSQQLVYHAVTGRPMSETEPGYPKVGFPFGWQAHQTAKNVHRGDYFGLTGRIMDLLGGLAMVYLSVSGIVMYWQMWKKRKAAGRGGLFWQ